MRAGTLRERLVIQRATITRDAHGQESRAWVQIGSVWGSVMPLKASERISGGGTENDITHTIRIRHFPGLLPTDRILNGARVFSIGSVINAGERNIMHEILATEVL